MRGVERLDAASIEIDLGTPVRGRNAFVSQRLNRGSDLRNIVLDQGVYQAKGMALLAAVDRPNQRPVARIEFFNAIFLLNDFRAIHSQPRLAGHHDVARQPGDQTHAAETTDRSGRQADEERGVAERARHS